MNLPEDLCYSKLHTWLKVKGKKGTVGITDFAQNELGEIVFVEFPLKGYVFHQDEIFGSLEAVKTTSDLFMPVAGTVLEINEKLKNKSALINTDPYGDGWLLKISIADMNEIGHLLISSVYQQFASL